MRIPVARVDSGLNGDHESWNSMTSFIVLVNVPIVWMYTPQNGAIGFSSAEAD